jgi:hypothetical protein
VVEQRFSTIPQAVVNGQPLDPEAFTFYTELIDRVTSNRTNRPGGVLKMPAQSDSTAATVADLKTDFNSLLAKLRSAGVMAE